MDLKYTESQKTVYTLERKRTRTNSIIPFKPLPNEDPADTNKRFVLYRNSILSQQTTSSKIKNDISTKNLSECADIIKRSTSEQIDSVILLPNSSISTSDTFLNELVSSIKSPLVKTVFLNSKEDTTMRSVLKTIVSGVITDENLEDDLDFDRRLPFDLDLVDDWCQLQSKPQDIRVVLIFEDIDSFNVELLNKLLKLLNSFKQKLQVKLIFNIEINLKSFLLKLDYDVLIGLKLHKLQIEQTELILNSLVDDIVLSNSLQLDQQLSGYILKRFEDNIKNVDEFLRLLKFSKMSFFFGNLLSVLFDDLSDRSLEIKDVYIDALRMLPSFKLFITTLAHSKENKELVLGYLEDKKQLVNLVKNSYKIYKVSFTNFQSIYNLLTKILAPILDPSFQQNHLDIYNKLSNPDEFKRFKFVNAFISNFITKNLTTLEQLEKITFEISKSSEKDDYLQRLNIDLKRSINFMTILKYSTKKEDKIHFDIELRKSIEIFIEILEKFLKNCIRTNDSYQDFYTADYADETKIGVYIWQVGLFHELLLINDTQVIEKNLVPNYRSSLIDGLINHERYLSTNTPSSSDILTQLNNTLDPLLPALFQISRETSLYLNIYDFYTVFKNSMQYQEAVRLLKILVETEDWERYLKDDERFGFLYYYFNNKDNDDQLWDSISLAWFYQKCEELVWMGYLSTFGNKKRRDILEKSVWKDI